MIPLVAPTISTIDRAAVLAATADGSVFDEKTVRAFKDAFAAYVGCGWAVAVNSGTTALMIALAAIPVGSVPSWCCVAITNAIQATGELVGDRFSDTAWDVRTAHAYSDSALRVHMFGRETGGEGAPALEDWTLSLGGVKQLQARLGVCSTSAAKMMSTGRGGLLFGNDENLHGSVRDLAYYETHLRFGYGAGMTSMQATLGLSQLEQLPSFIARRRSLAALYTEAFRDAGIECPDSDCGSVFFRYLIAVKSPAAKVVELAAMGVEAGRGVYPPLHQLAGIPDKHYPGTMRAVDSLLSVPVHPSITDAEAGYIIESVLATCAP